MAAANERNPVERIVERDLRDGPGIGKPMSSHVRQYQRTLEAYVASSAPPRWMERASEIDRGIERERRRLTREYGAMRERFGRDPQRFAERWRAYAHSRDFSDVNELIRQHNEWYPIERRLPIDMRTRDYVLVHGRSYRHPELTADWVLDQFPASA
jgi:hypothetical protein